MMIGHGLQNLTDAPDMNKDPLIKDMLGKAASAPTLCRYLADIDERCKLQRLIKGCPVSTEQLDKYDPDRIGSQFFDLLNELLLEAALETIEELRQAYSKHPFFKGAPLKTSIIVDADSSFMQVYGTQEEKAYCGKNHANGFFPLMVYVNGLPAHLQNAPGATDGRKLLENCLGNILSQIREKFPTANVLLRADSGFNSSRIIEICEQHGCLYIIGFTQNKILINRVCDQLYQQIRDEQCTEGLLSHLPNDMIRVLEKDWWMPPERNPVDVVERFCGGVQGYQAEGWKSMRRIFYRLKYNREHDEVDFRFIQTNLDDDQLLSFSARRGEQKALTNAQHHFDTETACKMAIEAYDGIYCDRALCELYIRDFKEIKGGYDLSCHGFFANWFKLMLVAFFQQIIRRCLLLAGKKVQTSIGISISTLRKRIFNCAAQIRFYARRVEVVTPPPYEHANLCYDLIAFCSS